jgi:hypothetical protein
MGAMCKASCLSAADLVALAGSVLQLHAYFQAYSWDITWASSQVRHSAYQIRKCACQTENMHVRLSSPFISSEYPPCFKQKDSHATTILVLLMPVQEV